MRPYKIRLSKDQHTDFLLENRHDPVTGELLKDGDEIFICKNEKIAYLAYTWKDKCPNGECGCKETLRQLPKSRSFDRFEPKKPKKPINPVATMFLLILLFIGVIAYYNVNSDNKNEQYTPSENPTPSSNQEAPAEPSSGIDNQLEKLQQQAEKLIKRGCLILPTKNCNKSATSYLIEMLDLGVNSSTAQKLLYDIIRNRQIEACKHLNSFDKNSAIELYNKTQGLLDKYRVSPHETALRFSKQLRMDIESYESLTSFSCENGRKF